MNKKKLIEVLKNALIAEEKSIPIYTKHLDSAVFWTGLGQEKADKVKTILSKLARGSTIHKQIIENLIKRLEGET
jgi:rubrerythrin